MRGIYTGLLPAEKRERLHEGFGGTNERELAVQVRTCRFGRGREKWLNTEN